MKTLQCFDWDAFRLSFEIVHVDNVYKIIGPDSNCKGTFNTLIEAQHHLDYIVYMRERWSNKQLRRW